MKRWETMAVVGVAAMPLLVPGVARAAGLGGIGIPGYTFSVPVKQAVISGLDISDAGNLQMGNANNKGQFCMDFSSSNQGGEREYFWDGIKLIKVADDSKPLPDGAIMGGGNTWSPTGCNNNGIVAWVVDPSDHATGSHYVVAFDSAAGTYTIVERTGDPAPGGGNYEDGPATLSNPAREREGFCSSGKAGSFPGEPPGPRLAGLELPGWLSLPAALSWTSDVLPWPGASGQEPATSSFSRSGPGA